MQVHRHPLIGASLDTERALTSYRFGPQDETAPRVHIQASLHADELPGMVAAWYLKRILAELEAQARLKAKIVLVPLANPIGLNQYWFDTQMGRFEMRSGQDFNRRFPELGADVAMKVVHLLTDDEAHNATLIRAAMRYVLAGCEYACAPVAGVILQKEPGERGRVAVTIALILKTQGDDMLKNIDPLLNADILHALCAIGHGDASALPVVQREVDDAEGRSRASRSTNAPNAPTACVITTGENRSYGCFVFTKDVQLRLMRRKRS